MAVGMLLAGGGVSADMYRRVTERMFGNFPMQENQSPEGLIVHTAGESDQGFYVYDVWESKEHFERFVESQLGPALGEVDSGGGARPEPQFFGIDYLVKGPAL